MEFICAHCGLGFQRAGSAHYWAKKTPTGRFYCSRSCHDAALHGTSHPRYKPLEEKAEERTCRTCGQTFWASKRDIRARRKNGREISYCNRDCFDKRPKTFDRKAYMREWGISHRLERGEQAKSRYVLNREAERAYHRVWSRTHRTSARVREQRRRAQKKALPASLTASQWAAIKVAYRHRCAYCGTKESKRHPITMDHVIPLSKGGGTTPDNIVPACRSCNSAKKDRAPTTLPALRLLI